MFWEWICATTEVLFIFGQIALFLSVITFNIHLIWAVIQASFMSNTKDIKVIKDYGSDGGYFNSQHFNTIQQNNKYSGDPTYSYMAGNPSHKRYSI